jgi:putative oxidoreductase
LRDYAPLLLRLLLGALFIAHLYWKFAVLPGGVQTWWGNLERSGYPAVVPAYVLSAEFAGALLLIPGVLTRYVALYAMPMMAGAAQFWLVRKGFYFTQAGAELPLGLAGPARPAGDARRRPPGARRLAAPKGCDPVRDQETLGNAHTSNWCVSWFRENTDGRTDYLNLGGVR